MSKNSHFFEGFLVGAIVGAVAGVLLTPQSGRETRDKLKQMSKEAAQSLKETVETPEAMVHKTLEAIEQGFDKVSSMVDTSRPARRRSVEQD